MSFRTSVVKVGAATHLAASGDYQAALTFIDDDANRNPSPDELDLKAKILAQQGRYREAIVVWQRLLDQSPDRGGVYQAIVRARKMLNSPLARMEPQLKRFAIVLFIGLAILGLLSWLFSPDVDDQLDQLRAQLQQQQLSRSDSNIPVQGSEQLVTAMEELATLPEISNQLDQLVTWMRGANTEGITSDTIARPAPVRVPTSSGALPSLAIDLAGISTTVTGTKLGVVFDEGVFARGTRLRNASRQLLEQLATILAEHDTGVTVTVTGYTDKDPVQGRGDFTDNVSLAYARAREVAKVLREESGLPASTFRLAAAETLLVPYTERTSDERLKNRTATLTIEEDDSADDERRNSVKPSDGAVMPSEDLVPIGAAGSE